MESCDHNFQKDLDSYHKKKGGERMKEVEFLVLRPLPGVSVVSRASKEMKKKFKTAAQCFQVETVKHKPLEKFCF